MKWKWFQRRDGMVDQVGPATSYPYRAGSYGPGGHGAEREPDDGDPSEPDGAAGESPRPDQPGWNQRTFVFPRHTPLLTRGALQRVNQRPGAGRG